MAATLVAAGSVVLMTCCSFHERVSGGVTEATGFIQEKPELAVCAKRLESRPQHASFDP